MGEITEQIFGWSVEELRLELCTIVDYNLFRLRVSQIKDKFRDINQMMDDQSEFNKKWDTH